MSDRHSFFYSSSYNPSPNSMVTVGGDGSHSSHWGHCLDSHWGHCLDSHLLADLPGHCLGHWVAHLSGH